MRYSSQRATSPVHVQRPDAARLEQSESSYTLLCCRLIRRAPGLRDARRPQYVSALAGRKESMKPSKEMTEARKHDRAIEALASEAHAPVEEVKTLYESELAKVKEG